jgi:DNA-binding LacI/PurR family transcriptional regulator
MGSSHANHALGILAGGQSYNVLERPFHNIILAGLFEEAHRLGQEVRFFSFFDALLDPVFFNKNIHKDEISSLILILPSMINLKEEHERILDQIEERIDNVVCPEEQVKNWLTVVFDRVAAARQAVEHLIGLGYERIAFLALEDGRMTGYRQTLIDHGIPYDQDLVFVTDPTNLLPTSYRLTLQILQIEPRPTAIFAANDESAIAAIAAIKDQGLSVPNDLAIVSIDNTGVADMIRPGLTTVDVPKRRMASYALQVLMMRKNFDDNHAASIVLPTKLIVRVSCGANQH